MRDLAGELLARHQAGQPCAVATVVRVSGSAPRPPGASLLVAPDGTVRGSVSGGCVEGAVYEAARQVLASGRPELARFEYAAEDAFAVGLTCGGELEVLIQAVPSPQPGQPPSALVAACRGAEAGQAVALARVVTGPGPLPGAALAVLPTGHTGTTGDAGLDATVLARARAWLSAGHGGELATGPHGECERDEVRVFVDVWAPPPRMLVFGAVDYAAAVTRMGAFLGYRVTVCDARAVFATPERFPEADEVVVDWPHRYLAATPTDPRTAVCVLTHDPKFDIPLLVEALRRPLAYVGALGSRRTHAERLTRLRAAGLSEAELARLRSPIGLDLGGRTPEETAVAVAAELVAARHGGSGLPLSATDAPLHRQRAPRSRAQPKAREHEGA